MSRRFGTRSAYSLSLGWHFAKYFWGMHDIIAFRTKRYHYVTCMASSSCSSLYCISTHIQHLASSRDPSCVMQLESNCIHRHHFDVTTSYRPLHFLSQHEPLHCRLFVRGAYLQQCSHCFLTRLSLLPPFPSIRATSISRIHANADDRIQGTNLHLSHSASQYDHLMQQHATLFTSDFGLAFPPSRAYRMFRWAIGFSTVGLRVAM